MATRVVRDGLLTSERIDALSESAELFYRRLMNVADDHGRFFAKPQLLRSACYPLKDPAKIRLTAIESYLAECVAARLIDTYEVAGTKYLLVHDFGQRIQSKSKFPDPPESTVDHGDSPEPTVIPRLGVVVVEDEVVGGGGGGKRPPRKVKSQEQSLPDWLTALDGADAVPADDPLFEWAGKVGIPKDWLALAWFAFEGRYLENGKTYADWRAVFRKAVREDWLKLWRTDTRNGGFVLTAAGEMAQREMQA